jgi:hypothetical protein
MKPTKDQLAPNVPALIRDYIDAAITEAIDKVQLSRKLQSNEMEATVKAVKVHLEETRQFERLARSHLGIFVQE